MDRKHWSFFKCAFNNKSTNKKTSSYNDGCWHDIDWIPVRCYVHKLQKRIYTYSREGNFYKVRKLQNTLVNSYNAKLLAVKKVTENQKGKQKKETFARRLNSQQKYELAHSLRFPNCYSTKVKNRAKKTIPRVSFNISATREKKNPFIIQKGRMQKGLSPFYNSKISRTEFLPLGNVSRPYNMPPAGNKKSRGIQLLRIFNYKRIKIQLKSKKATIDSKKKIKPTKIFDGKQKIFKSKINKITNRDLLFGLEKKSNTAVLRDQAIQTLLKMALEPEWEAKFEPNSYGFRPGRNCHDAIRAILIGLEKSSKYVLVANLTKCLEKIDYRMLLKKINMKGRFNIQLKGLLKSIPARPSLLPNTACNIKRIARANALFYHKDFSFAAQQQDFLFDLSNKFDKRDIMINQIKKTKTPTSRLLKRIKKVPFLNLLRKLKPSVLTRELKSPYNSFFCLTAAPKNKNGSSVAAYCYAVELKSKDQPSAGREPPKKPPCPSPLLLKKARTKVLFLPLNITCGRHIKRPTYIKKSLRSCAYLCDLSNKFDPLILPGILNRGAFFNSKFNSKKGQGLRFSARKKRPSVFSTGNASRPDNKKRSGRHFLYGKWNKKKKSKDLPYGKCISLRSRTKVLFLNKKRHPKFIVGEKPDRNSFRPSAQAIVDLRELTSVESKKNFFSCLKFNKLNNTSIIAPLLANIALHGLEYKLKNNIENLNSYSRPYNMTPAGNKKAFNMPPAGNITRELKSSQYGINMEKFEDFNSRAKREDKPSISQGLNKNVYCIRYADDLVIMHSQKNGIIACKQIMEQWMSEIGLDFSLAKLYITHSLELTDQDSSYNSPFLFTPSRTLVLEGCRGHFPEEKSLGALAQDLRFSARKKRPTVFPTGHLEIFPLIIKKRNLKIFPTVNASRLARELKSSYNKKKSILSLRSRTKVLFLNKKRHLRSTLKIKKGPAKLGFFFRPAGNETVNTYYKNKHSLEKYSYSFLSNLFDKSNKKNFRKKALSLAVHAKHARVPGFDFSGFTIRQFKSKSHGAKNERSGKFDIKTLVVPSKENCVSYQRKLANLIHRRLNAPQEVLISELNQIIIGWTSFFGRSDALKSGVLQQMDYLLYLKLRKWAKRKSKTVKARKKYWKTEENQKWVFCTSKGTKLVSHLDYARSIYKYRKIQGESSPYDGNDFYWATRTGTNRAEMKTEL